MPSQRPLPLASQKGSGYSKWPALWVSWYGSSKANWREPYAPDPERRLSPAELERPDVLRSRIAGRRRRRRRGRPGAEPAGAHGWPLDRAGGGWFGLSVENPFPSPEHRLYELLAAEDSDSAHSRYNALVRRLVSYERAAESLAR